MNIVWYSNAPWNSSGYGTQTMQVVRRLVADGHRVAIAANHGSRSVIDVEGGLPGVAILPMHRNPTGSDILPSHWKAYHDHFGPTLILTLWDVWPLEVGTDALCPSCGHEFPVSVKPLDGLPIASWVPIDHDPVPPKVANWCRVHQPIAMSRFGKRALEAIGIASHYVPHAIERVFTPGDRDAARRELGWDLDGFYVMVNAANKGWPSRKSWAEVLDAASVFLSRHPLARLYLHTDRTGQDAPDLGAIMTAMGVPGDRVLWSPSYQTAVGLYGPDKLAQVYRAADVLLSPSKGEGFGIPVIEAQACFPGDVVVSADGIEAGMSRTFTGSLVTIDTPLGAVEATPDHPFWTDNGWVRAGDLSVGSRLLYDPGHAEARIVSGRAEDVVRAVSGHAAASGGSDDGAFVLVGAVGQAHAGTQEVIRSDGDDQACLVDRDSVGVYRGADRRRGHGVHPEVLGQMEATLSDRQHLADAAGLAGGHCPGTVRLHGASAGRTPEGSVLHVPRVRDRVGGDVRAAAALHGHQARADGGSGRVLPDTSWAGSNGRAERTAVVASLASPGAEYQTVTAVGRREVVGLPVYNLKTRDGTYSANGFLVHNCGTPVIVSDFSAQPELVGGGWLVDGQREWDAPHDAFWFTPFVESIVARLEDAYQARGDSDIRARAIAKAAEYDADRVYAEHWRPLLPVLEADLLSDPVEVAA